MRRFPAVALLVLAVGLTVSASAQAVAEPIHIPYRASFAGSEIGVGALTVEVEGSHYRLAVDAIAVPRGKSKGARVTAHVTGRIPRSALSPDQYRATIDRDGVKRRIALGFANGVLSMVTVLPPGPNDSGRTRPSPQQSRGVVDPLSALALPAAPPNLAPLSACGRTQRVFDGRRRYDVSLFPSRVEKIEIAQQPRTALVCRVELRSASAPPATPRAPERWPNLRPRGQHGVVWLAAVASGRLLVPVRIESRFRFGAFSVEATDAAPFPATQQAAALR